MPKKVGGKSFTPNPYRILKKPANRPKRIYNRDISSMKGYCGHFLCRLDAHTPLEVNYKTKAKFHNEPKIPGSSIKGVIRSVLEFVGHGCVSTGRPDHTWASCTGEAVCVACHMFGNLDGGNALRGRVRISEAFPLELKDDMKLFEKEKSVKLYQGSPKEKHTAFYGAIGHHGVQKFYHHQADFRMPRDSDDKHASTLYPVSAGSSFVCRISFEGLDAKELALLHYCLVLEPGLLHKMGRGKGRGFGSVKIHVTEISIENERSRYTPGEEPLITLPDDVQAARQGLEQDTSLDEMRLMMCFALTKGKTFSYPGYQWFNNNSQVGLRSPVDILGTELKKEDPVLPKIEGKKVVIVANVSERPEPWASPDAWRDADNYRQKAREIAAFNPYGPNLVQSVQPYIDDYKALDETEIAARKLLFEAFKAMFASRKTWKVVDKSGWKKFRKKHEITAEETTTSSGDASSNQATPAVSPYASLPEHEREALEGIGDDKGKLKTVTQQLEKENNWSKEGLQELQKKAKQIISGRKLKKKDKDFLALLKKLIKATS